MPKSKIEKISENLPSIPPDASSIDLVNSHISLIFSSEIFSINLAFSFLGSPVHMPSTSVPKITLEGLSNFER